MTQARQHKFFEQYMNLVGPLGNLMFYVQAYTIFDSKTAGSVSLPGFSISIIGLTSWLLYGIALKNTPLIIANSVGAVGAVLVVLAIALYSG